MNWVVICLYALAALLWALACYNALRHELHLFQQSGYRPKRYARRSLEKPLALMPYLIMIFGADAVTLAHGTRAQFFGVAAFGVCAAVLGWCKVKKKEKKPLVWTARAKRLFVTSVLLLALSAVLPALFLPRGADEPISSRAFCIAGVAAGLMPLVLSLACVINSPTERLINKHYIDDARRILGETPNLVVVGVTGSYGKTSVKNYLAALLGAKYSVLATPESYNTTLGAVRTVRENLKPTHEVFVCEMGARQPGDIREICELVKPRHGIITAVGEQHLETFGSRENIRKTKYELADALPADGRLFINLDSDGISSAPPGREYTSYGLGEGCGYRGEILSVSKKGTAFRVTAPDGERVEFSTPLIGAACVQNLTGAIACARSLGVSFEEMKRPIMRMRAVEHRMQLIERGGVTIIDDAYNSNPAGARAALDTLAMFECRRVLVTPGMVELGEREKELNREMGEYAASRVDAVALVGESRTKPIYEGLVGAGFSAESIFVAPTLDDAMKWVYAQGGEKAILLENDLPDNY